MRDSSKRGFAANPELAAAAGRLGGAIVKETYGKLHYSRIGKLGGTALVNRHGKEHLRAIARLGGLAKGETYRRLRLERGDAELMTEQPI